MFLCEYEPDTFDGLNEFQAARELLREHRHRLVALGRTICRHRMHDCVGISLVHHHFKLTNDERLVKEEAATTANIRPEPGGDGADLVPYLWKLSSVRFPERPVYRPLEFIRYSPRAADQAARIRQSPAFLAEMADTLRRMGLVDTFGIRSLHDSLAVGPEETVLETTDHVDRVLTLSVVHGGELAGSDSTETAWAFGAGETGEAILDCYSHCFSHCSH